MAISCFNAMMCALSLSRKPNVNSRGWKISGIALMSFGLNQNGDQVARLGATVAFERELLLSLRYSLFAALGVLVVQSSPNDHVLLPYPNLLVSNHCGPPCISHHLTVLNGFKHIRKHCLLQP